MKKIIAFIFLLIAIIVAFYFWPKKGVAPIRTSQVSQIKLVSGPNVLARGDFSISVPDGWRERDVLPGTVAVIMPNDDSGKNYFSVGYESINGRDLGGFAQKVKQDLAQNIGQYRDLEEKDITINNLPAKLFSLSANKDGEDIIVYMVILKGKNDGGWILTMNTQENSSSTFRQKFEEIIQTFSLK